MDQIMTNLMGSVDASSWCLANVKNGARIAKAFAAHAPTRSGAAVRPYADAAKLIRTDIEQIAVTGATESLRRQ